LSPSPEPAALPRVAILGRPNVGKSTLFNVLVGRRRAITHSTPGVTRDPVEADVSFAGKRLRLVDTGGYAADGAGMERLVAEKSLEAARSADVVLLVLDARETTTADESFIERLRPLSSKLVLVVNKVDTPDRDPLVWNHLVHGFPLVLGVSAAHSRNLDDLRDLVASLLAEKGAQGPHLPREGSVVRVAVLGKPNSGKSLLTNRLVGEEKSIVSPVPGTTRDVVEGGFTYRATSFRILDTAGIRRRSRVHDPVEYYSVGRARQSVSEADVVLLLVDSTQGLSDQDKKIAGYAVREGRGIIIVLSKWDLQSRSPGRVKELREEIRFHFPVLSFAPVVPVSGLTGGGVKRLLDTALEVWKQLQSRVGTGRLNQALQAWVAHYPLPVRGKNYKIRFATQIGANPVRFVVFVNRLSGFPVAYTQYLENCIRRDLGFPSIPVSIELRESRKTRR
jgi:GTP-binding protein